MTFLAPALLAIAAGIAVPILLHLLHRSEGRRLSFPALRYLLRTEKDHARRIRTRQLLLLLLRSAVVVLAALAGARLVIRGDGPAHPPTAVAILLDNSLSSGRVVGEGRVLDSLKAAASDAVRQAGPLDRFWVVRVGESWDVAAPLPPSAALRRIEQTEVSGAYGDLTAALARAHALLETSSLAAREIHLLSDLQATGFDATGPELAGLPVVVYGGVPPAESNRYVRGVTLGGGLPPRANRRTEVAVSVGGAAGDTSTVAVRVFLAGQLRGGASTPVEGTTVLPVGPFPEGRLEGYAETDPDELRADDRFFVSARVRPPPTVAVVGDAGVFLEEALTVLEAGSRIRLGSPGEADVLVLVWGEGLPSLRPDQRAVVLPGDDPALRTALARRLAEAGVPVSMEAGDEGQDRVSADRTGVGLEDVRVVRLHRLTTGDDPATVSWASLSDGTPWLLESRTSRSSVLLVGSRLDPAETSLPLDAAMIPLVEWMLSEGETASELRRIEAGAPLLLPVTATAVEDPSGHRATVDGTHEYRFTGEPGIYTVLAGEDVVDRIAVNAPLRESLLPPINQDRLDDHLGSGVVSRAMDRGEWARRVYTARQGREVWRLLVAAGLLLLLAESWVASSGGVTTRSSSSGSSGIGRASVA